MEALLDALGQLGEPIRELVVALAGIVLPWMPLLAWIVFWLFAVNWLKLREIMAQGGWIGVALIGAVIVLVWGAVSPPLGGTNEIFGFPVSNFVEKFVYVAGLFCIMFLAGALQLSGFTSNCCAFEEPVAADQDHADDGHGHGEAHGTEHDTHATPTLHAHH